MYRLWVKYGKLDKYELTNNPAYEVIEVDGLLPPEATINSTVIANNDGAVFNSARANDRPISITIKPQQPVEDNRQRLYRYFKTKQIVTIYYKNENRDLMINGYVENFDGSLFEQSQTLIIHIRCLDPYFSDRIETIVNMSQIMDMFEFPFSIEEEGIPFSVIDKALMQSVYNYGDTETGLIIELTASGEVVNPIIYSVDTREYFGLNFTMQYGDMIRINTNNFNKKVELIRYGESRNIINSITKGNKWFKLFPGDNLFTYACTSGEAFLSFKFSYANKYEGV